MSVKTNFEQSLFELPDGNAIAFGGRWHGWMFTRHPDGQWVSIRKCDQLVLPDTAPWFGQCKVMQALMPAAEIKSASNVNRCPACNRMFIDGETCSRGGCPMGGDF